MTVPVYSVVVPVYNSSASLGVLVERLHHVFAEEVRESFEIVFIDDGSPDPETWPELERLATRYNNVVLIRLTRNFGKSGAVVGGLSVARGRWVVLMDDDLQHPPEEIPKLISQRSQDVVMGTFESRQHSLPAKFASFVKSVADTIILKKPKHIRNSPFKLIKAEIVRGMLQIRTPHPSILAMILFVTKNIVCVEVRHEPRLHGRSGYSWGGRLQQFSNLAINNSSILLRAIAAVGIFVALLSVGYGAFLVLARLFGGRPIPGWTSLMVISSVLGGLNLLSISVVGEYLVRIIKGTESRPAFVIREMVSPKSAAPRVSELQHP